MIDDRTNREFLFSTRSRTKRASMIVHRTPSTSSAEEEEPLHQQQQHGSEERRRNDINKVLSSNSNNNGRSRSVYMVGFFAIAAVCLILSLGFFTSKDASGGGGGGYQQHLDSAVAIDSSPIDLPKSISKPHTPITTPTTTIKIKDEQGNNDDGSGLTIEELKSMIADLAGSDQRIMRWNAQKHTAKRQRQGGCSQLRQGLDVILNPNNDVSSLTRKQLAAEFATWCITDNPTQREIFSKYHHADDDDDADVDLHKAVVDLVGATANDMASAMAGHLIYIASFSNTKNQQTFVQQGAVEALAKVVMNKQALPIQVMWAAAALQNLAASYCDTEHDGRCYWDWNSKNDNHVTVTPDSLPIVSDGTLIRQRMLQIDGLVQALTEWACTGPVHGKASATNIFPGENGQAGRDDANPNIVAWAATGTLKNLALEPTAKPLIELSLSCLCRLKKSPDWLEKLKAKDALHFMRRGDHPCWFDESSSSLCIDDNFIDVQEYSCDSYGNPRPGDCDIADAVFPNITASQACCACGGGTKVENGSRSGST